VDVIRAIIHSKIPNVDIADEDLNVYDEPGAEPHAVDSSG
jgi:hypothetical protein